MMKFAWMVLIGMVIAPSVPAETLNLQQAIHRAMQSDPRIAERKHLVDAARALLEEALGQRSLHIDVNAFVGLAPGVDGGFYENGASTCSAGSNCTPRSDAYKLNDGIGVWSNVQFTIIKPLYTFGKISNYAAAAQGNVDVKRGDTLLQRDQTRMQVTQAYYGYLAARDTRYLFEDVRQRLTGAEDLTQRWLKQGRGKVKQSDLYALQTGLALVDKYLAQSNAVEHIALDGLKVLTGVGMHNPLTVADDHIRPVPLPTQKLAELQAQALQKRPEVAQLEAGLRARRALVAAHKAEAKPDVYVGLAGSLAYTTNRNRLDNPYLIDPYNHAGVTPVVGVRWQWTAGVQPARVARAEAQMNALVEKSSYARQGIPFQVARAYHNMIGAYQSVQALEQGSRSGRRWMISRYADYEAGLEEASKVLTALQGYVTAHSDYLATVNAYDVDVATLMRVSGANE